MSSSINGDLAGELRLLLGSMGRAADAALSPGQRLPARVIEMLLTGDVLLELGQSKVTVSVPTNAAMQLQPGDRVRLEVVTVGPTPAFRIVTEGAKPEVRVAGDKAAAPPQAAQAPAPAQPAGAASQPATLTPRDLPVILRALAEMAPTVVPTGVPIGRPGQAVPLGPGAQVVQPGPAVQVIQLGPAAQAVPPGPAAQVVQPGLAAQVAQPGQPAQSVQLGSAAPVAQPGPAAQAVQLGSVAQVVQLGPAAQVVPLGPPPQAGQLGPGVQVAQPGQATQAGQAGEIFLRAAVAAELRPAVVEQIQRLLAPLQAALPPAELAPTLRAFLSQSGLFTENHLRAALQEHHAGDPAVDPRQPSPSQRPADQRSATTDVRVLLGALTTPGTPVPEPVRVFGDALLQQQLVVAEQVAATNGGQVAIPFMFGEERVDIRFTWDREARQETRERSEPDGERAISLGVFVNLNTFGGIEARINWKPESFAVTFYVEREETRAIVEAGLSELSKELSASGFSAVAANVWLNPERVAAGVSAGVTPVRRAPPAGTILDVMV